MDWNFGAAGGQQLAGALRATWERLRSAHPESVAGRCACPASRIGEAYDVTSDEAERPVNSFAARNRLPPPGSLR
jgi:hypothetical protein